MQQSHINELMMQAFKGNDDGFDPPAFADKIKEETTNLPAGKRTPYVEEIVDLVTFMRNYKLQTPKASKREIREAAKRKFGVTILPNTKK